MGTTAKSPNSGEALKQLAYLASALKAPRITEAAARLADHARDAGWTHEEYLAAVLGVPGHHVGDRRLIGGLPPRALWRRSLL